MANGWTSERRAKQAERIRAWRPWEMSTGPKTEVGKAVVSRNAWKGGTRHMLRNLARALGEQREILRNGITQGCVGAVQKGRQTQKALFVAHTSGRRGRCQ